MKLSLFICMSVFVFCNAKAQSLNEEELLHYILESSYGLKGAYVTQSGDENLAEIKAQQINVNQIGSNQQFYYTETSLIPTDFNVNIRGNNSTVEILGNNQILDGITINIEGDFRNVVIRNYP